ncbi:hypothetical protein R5R35_003288 [Gryllus longicercus]
MASVLPSAPLPLLALLGLLLLCAAAPSASASDDDAAAAAEAEAGAAGGPAEGAAPALLARLRAWEASPAAAATALLLAPEDLDAQEALAARRVKRTGAQSLSIVAPLDVLRQRLMNELNRRRMRELQGSRIQQNRQLLTSIGKRLDARLPPAVALWGSWDDRLAAEQA